MKIHNLRLGHATNSSSSHSIVIAPANYGNMPHTRDGLGWGDYQYGWEQFLLADPESKTKYFAAQLYSSLTGRNGISDEIATATIRDWLDVDLSDKRDVGIDHQSIISFPRNHLTKKFVQDMMNFVCDDRVVVYGGNDNGDSMDIPSDFENIGFFSHITDVGSGVRLKNDGKFWIFYNSKTGSKMRFSFDVDDVDAETYAKSTTPELVDVKITDYCPRGCEFCYQASTKKGIHADIKQINSLLWTLKSMEVFEVAIGGGEPTMHPDFAEILDTCSYNDIRPNFTTYSKAWLKKKKIVDAVKANVGGVGVSIHTEKDLDLMEDIAEKINGNRRNFSGHWTDEDVSITGQHVLGTHPLDETIELIAEAWNRDMPVLLLGYKDVGFGSNFKPYDMTGIELALKLLLESPENRYHVTLSVDTAVLDQHPLLCETLGVTKILTTSAEGAFSMYIDAVEGRMAKSSYVPSYEYVKLHDEHGRVMKERITKEFSRW